ncbi:MAG: SRPBCC family protein [Bauldia sp.]|nr:SRPBCC family protein [Bauldia sp.]
MDSEHLDAEAEPPPAPPAAVPDGGRPPTSRAARILRWFGIAIVVVVVAAVVVAFALPRHAIVTRSVEVAAPPAAVFPLLADLRRFGEWSPWPETGPAVTFTYTGPIDGIGQTVNWSSKDPGVGEGSLTITGIDSDKRVDLSVVFGDKGLADAYLAIEPNGAGSTLTGGFDSDLGFNPISRYLGTMMDGLVGPGFERSLARLKQAAENPPPAPVADE